MWSEIQDFVYVLKPIYFSAVLCIVSLTLGHSLISIMVDRFPNNKELSFGSENLLTSNLFCSASLVCLVDIIMRLMLAVYCVCQSAFQWHYWMIATYPYGFFCQGRECHPRQNIFPTKTKQFNITSLNSTSLKSSRYNMISESLLLQEL